MRLWTSLLVLFAAGACEQRDASPTPADQPATRTTTAPAKADGDRTTPPERSPIEPAATAKPEQLAAAADAATATPPASPVERTDAGSQAPRKRRSARVIRPQPGQTACIEMYGECTRDDPPVCTSSALALDCGERGRLPSTGEPLHCVCP